MTRLSLALAVALGACLPTGSTDPEIVDSADTDATDAPVSEWEDVTPVLPGACTGKLMRATGIATTEDDTRRASVALELPAGTASMHLVTETPDRSSVVLALDGPGGTALDPKQWWGDELLTLGVYWIEDRPVRGYTWPLRGADAPLEAGVWTWGLGVGADSGLDGGVSFRWTAYANVDDDPTRGCLSAQVVFARGVDDDPAVEAAVRGAVAEWARIYEAEGLKVIPRWGTSDVDPDHDGYPSPAIGALTAERAPHEVTLLITDTVGGPESTRLGRSQLGGPMAAGDNSEVVVGWTLHAGTDGLFSPEEKTFMGQTIAHEVGHYLGLAHPVEVDSAGQAIQWDAFSDTEACTDADTCTRDLGENLMFPWSWCWGHPNDCEAAETLTDEQAAALRLFPGAL